MKRILVVDDEPDIIKIVIFRLKKAGYDITQANNGREGLDLLEAGQTFDLILLDLVMPVMDGYEMCRHLQALESAKNIPVIILSASSSGDMRERFKNLKINDFISKPFDPEDLQGRIKKVLG